MISPSSPPSEQLGRDESQSPPRVVVAAAVAAAAAAAAPESATETTATVVAAAVDLEQPQERPTVVGLTSAFRIQTELIAYLERAVAAETVPAERARLERMLSEAVAHATDLIRRAVAETMRQQQMLRVEVDAAVERAANIPAAEVGRRRQFLVLIAVLLVISLNVVVWVNWALRGGDV